MVTAVVAAALVLLCVMDASLVGYRSVCGRSAFVHRAPLDRRAAAFGGTVGLGVVATLGAWFGGLLLVVEDRGSTIDELTAAGLRMLAVYAGLGLLTGVALAVFFVAPPRWGSFSMVTILGPLTLLRPVVLAAGAVAATSSAGSGQVVASIAVVLVAVAVESFVLERWGDRAAAAYRPSPRT